MSTTEAFLAVFKHAIGVEVATVDPTEIASLTPYRENAKWRVPKDEKFGEVMMDVTDKALAEVKSPDYGHPRPQNPGHVECISA